MAKRGGNNVDGGWAAGAVGWTVMGATISSDAAAGSVSGRGIRSWEGLIWGLACGAAVWALVQAVHPIFQVPRRFHIAGINAPVSEHVAFRGEQDRVDRWHAMLYLGSLGMLLGAVLGMRALAVRGTGLWIALAAPLGAVGGALGGVLAAMFYAWVRDKIGHADMQQIAEAQLLVGVPLGLCIGLGLGVGCGGLRGGLRGLLLGAVGGAVFGGLYPLSVALLLPAANTEVLAPEEAVTRLVWLGMLGGCVGLFSASAVIKTVVARSSP